MSPTAEFRLTMAPVVATWYTAPSGVSTEANFDESLRWLRSVRSIASLRNVSSLFLAFRRNASCDKLPFSSIRI
eukprot:Gb_25984 [translate_table: standard]